MTMTPLQELLKQWEARSKDALPTDAMLINKHIRELRTALAQQVEQAKPVAYITDTHQGPMVWTTEMYGEACMYCDDGEFPVPLYTAAPAPQTQEPHAWMIQGSHATWKGEHAEMDAKAEAKRCGGTCYAYPLYTQPAQMRILTDEQIKSVWAQYCSYPGGILDFARAIREVK